MKNPFILACFAAAAFGCSASQTEGTTPPADSSGQTVDVPPPSATAPLPTAPSATPPSPSATAPEPTASPEPQNPPAGRLAFTSCTDEQRKAKGCTKEMKPVCGEVDTGIRCIKAPCPSSTKQTFSNACMACMEPKTNGYWPISCEEMSKPSAL